MCTIFQDKVGSVSVQELLVEGVVFKIPSYQRGYRWQTKQVKALIDVLRIGGKSRRASTCFSRLLFKSMRTLGWLLMANKD